jgi:hypothetical protein
VVKLVRTSGKSIGQVSIELELTETAARARVKRAAVGEKKDPSGPPTSEERGKVTRLRRELRTVTIERDPGTDELVVELLPNGDRLSYWSEQLSLTNRTFLAIRQTRASRCRSPGPWPRASFSWEWRCLPAGSSSTSCAP